MSKAINQLTLLRKKYRMSKKVSFTTLSLNIIEVCPNKITNKMKQGLTMETRVKALMMT